MYKKQVLTREYSTTNIIVDIDFESISSLETESEYEDLTYLIESLTFDQKLGTVTYRNITVLIADNCLLFDPIRNKIFINIFHIIEENK